LPPVPGEFLLAVVGPDLAAFAGAEESTLKSKSYLAVNKEKIAPARVEVDHAQDGRVAGVVFHFPKTDTAGHALVSSGDKNVRFVEGGAGTGFEVSFSPRQMVDSHGPDL